MSALLRGEPAPVQIQMHVAAAAGQRLTRENICEGLTAQEIAWGQRAVVLQTSANGRKKWLESQSPRQALMLYAAAFRVAKNKKEGLRLAMAGQTRDAFNWVNLDPDSALCQSILAAGFINDGDFALL